MEKEFEDRKEYFDSHYVQIDNTDEYYKIMQRQLIKKFILNIVLVIGIILLLLCLIFIDLDHLDNMSSRLEGRMVLMIFLLLAFVISIPYFIIKNIRRIYLFKKKKISCYKAIVSDIDYGDKLYVKSTNKNNAREYKYNNNFEKKTFENYKCIGISKKEIINKEVIVVLAPGFTCFIYE